MKKKDQHKKFWEEIRDYDEVFNDFADPGLESPLLDYLEQKSSNLTVADLGCGPGKILPFLSKKFKRVIAVDYAENQLKEAQRRNAPFTNIEYQLTDLRDLSSLYNTVDIAVSINGIVTETVGDVEKIISEIYQTIKPNGEFIGHVTSFDTVLHFALLKHQELLDQGVEEREATKKIEEFFSIDRQLNLLGFVRDSPKDPVQKYFHPFEIDWRFKKAGFSSVYKEKIYYSWDYCRDNNYGYFPEHERIWNWFVVAKKEY